MVKHWKNWTACFLAVLCCMGALPAARAAAEEAEPDPEEKTWLQDLVYYADAEQKAGAVSPQRVGEEVVLFLPASADLSALRLWYPGEGAELLAGEKRLPLVSGEAIDLTALYPSEPENGIYSLELVLGEERETLAILRSAHIASLYITSRGPEQGREWVDADKENKAKKGGFLLLRPDGSTIFSGTMKNIKSRGNSTWLYPKKPYQIKLNEAADLMETGDGAEADTTWILLANYVDGTLLRNQLSFALAEELGLAYTPHVRPVDLYYDGEYRGCYLLAEKTEIGEGRVDIRDLEEEIEAANPDTPELESLETRQSRNSYGNVVQYVEGVRLPADYSGGYLLELDYEARAREERSWFTTSQGLYVVVKSPEYLPEEAVLYISELFQRMEDSLLNGGVEPQSGRSCWELVDRESLAKEYLLLELSRDMDAFLSSTFFYKPEGEEKLYAGPVWDFDSAYGISLTSLPMDSFVAGQSRLGLGLLPLPSFREAVLAAWDRLQPALDTLLGDAAAGAAGGMRSLAELEAEYAACRRMDALLWPETLHGDYAGALQELGSFIRDRNAWLRPAILEVDKGQGALPRFMDASPQDWFYGDMVYAMDAGIFQGMNSAGTFCAPKLALSRAMAVTILYRMAGTPETGAESPFPDVPADAWYAKAAAWAAEQGILSGYPDGSFKPGRGISRQEFAVLLYRYAGRPAAGQTVSFADEDSIAAFALPAVSWAAELELLRGDDLDRVTPEKTIIRAEAAAILHRYLEREAGRTS